MASPVWQSSTGITAASAASCVYTLPASIAANDIIVLQLYKENTAAVTPPAGFTQLVVVATTVGVHQQVILWKRMAGGESGTVTASWTGSTFRSGTAHRISGCVTSGDPWSTNFTTNFNNTNANATPAVSLATSPTNSLLLWGATDFAGSSTTWTQPTGFTARQSDEVVTVGTLDNTAGGATGSLSGSNPGADTMTAFLGALSSPGAAASIPPILIMQTRRQ